MEVGLGRTFTETERHHMMTHHTLMCIPAEERLTRLARDGVKVVAKRLVPADPTSFVVFMLAWTSGLRPLRAEPGRCRLGGTR